MKTQTKIDVVVCDCCGKEIPDVVIAKSLDGSLVTVKDSYVELGDFDICESCCKVNLKVLYDTVGTTEVMLKVLKKTKNYIKPLAPFSTLWDYCAK